MLKLITVLVIFVSLVFSVKAQQTSQKFVDELGYLLSLPDGYAQDTTKKWPLLIFLHGSGERGADLEKVKVHGPPKLVEQGKKFPFIIVSPQCKEGRRWESDLLFQMIRSVIKANRVDPERIYLTGLSMGGYGTWDLAIKYPDMFAAIAPICGGGTPEYAWKLRNMPIWNFHGALDNVVPLIASGEMVDAVKVYNPSIKYTIYPDATHDSWTVTYNNDSLYQWFLQHKRFSYTQVEVPASSLKSLTGTYVNEVKDTVVVTVSDKKLLATSSIRGRFELTPASPLTYFIDKNAPVSIQFIPKRKTFHGGMMVLGDRMINFRKLPN